MQPHGAAGAFPPPYPPQAGGGKEWEAAQAAAYPPQAAYGYGAPPQGAAAGGYPPPQAPAGYPAVGGFQQPPPAAYGGFQQPPPAAYGGSPPPPQQPPRSNSANLGGSYVVNIDGDTDTSMKFAETAVRNGFVRKVFGIVGIQMLITVGVACLCLFHPGVKAYVRTHSWLYWISWGLAIALLLVLACVEKARRTWPTNMILLGAFTLAQAFLVGMISAQYNIEAVMLAFLVTGVAVAAISIFAINTKIDATKWGTMLLVALVAFVVLLLVGMFWVSRVLYLVIAGIACLLFSAYLLFDIQLIMGGKTYSLSPDEYVFAALNIYLDIINLFLWVLTLIGLAGGNNN